MAYDRLARFRRPGQPTGEQPPSSPPPGGKSPYEAYKAQDRKPERLEIRQVLHPWHMPSYRYLFDISYDGRNGTIANLIFTPMNVEIRGKNLQAVIAAIGDGQCQFIQDFDARAFLEPTPDQPIIESIKITKSSSKLPDEHE